MTLSSGPRLTQFRIEILDLGEQHVGDLDGVLGGHLEYSIFTAIRSSAQLQVLDIDMPLPWTQIRVRIWITVNGDTWPLATLRPSAPREAWSDLGRAWDVELLDKLSILDRSAVTETFTLASGTAITSAVRSLIEGSGEPAGALTESDAVLRTSMTWDAGTSRLRVINDLLDAGGFYALWCDGLGQYQVSPYLLPASRPTSARIVDDSESIYAPDFTAEEDIYSVPNRVIGVSQSTGDEPALVAVASNTDPSSPYSFQSLGVWVDHVETEIEVASQEVLDSYVRRRLVELSSTSQTVTIAHDFMPLDLNQVVHFTNTSAGIDGRFAVVKMGWPVDELGEVTTTLREVIAL